MQPSILHVDLDAFYASVEQLLNPSLAGRPVLVGRGVVLAASYEARAYGIRAPMGVKAALARCPHAVVVQGSFSTYSDLSKEVMEICRDFTPLVEQVSIDEAFLDVRGTTHILGSPESLGETIRKRVRDEVGLPISVGIAGTKFLAKVASAQAKPDGLILVPSGEELRWLHPLPVEVVWGVGPVTSAKLRERGLITVGDLAATDIRVLQAWLGKRAGAHLHRLAHNIDQRPVVVERRAGSVGAQSALGRGITDLGEADRVVLGLADRIGRRLRRRGRTGRAVSVRMRFVEGTVSRSTVLSEPVNSTAAIRTVAGGLVRCVMQARAGRVTLIGVSVSKLTPAGPLSLELPFDRGTVTRMGSPLGAAHLAVDLEVDRIRERFGKESVGRASLLLSRVRPAIPDEFRELAEKD